MKAAKIESGQYLLSVFPQTKATYWKPNLSKSSSLSIKHSELELNSADALYLDTTVNLENIAFFSKNINVINGDKIEITAKVKLESYNGDITRGGCTLYAEDDQNSEVLILRTDGIYLFNSQQFYAMDTTDSYHVYQIVAEGSSYKVFVDSKQLPVIDALFLPPSDGTARRMVGFGDGSSVASSKSLWAYVKYKLYKK